MEENTDLLRDNQWWEKTLPDIPAVKEDDITQTFGSVDIPANNSPRVPSLALVVVGIAAGLALAFSAGYLIKTAPPAEHPSNVTTSVLPAPTATVTKPGRTVRLPGPTVTRRLRATVTVRATRTVPGPTVTVSETSPTLSAPDGPK